MQLRAQLGFVLGSLAMLAACSSSGAEPDASAREEARRAAKEDSSFDFCDFYGWYDDDVCDEFCVRPDPDCEASCASDDDCPQPLCLPGGPCPSNVCTDGECTTKTCPPVMCALACEFGFETGADGCDICECAPPPGGCLEDDDCPQVQCLPGGPCPSTICVENMCVIEEMPTDSCMSGDDCPQPQCLPGGFCPSVNCIENMCVMEEPPSDACMADADCPQPVCLPGGPCPRFVCEKGMCMEETSCAPVMCELFCENGFAEGDDGCPICACAEPEEGPFCGTRGATPCGDEEYCFYPEAANCGRGDLPGTCRSIDIDACPAVIDPVCGCDGNTYQNACQAASMGVSVDYAGACACATDDDCPDPLCPPGAPCPRGVCNEGVCGTETPE